MKNGRQIRQSSFFQPMYESSSEGERICRCVGLAAKLVEENYGHSILCREYKKIRSTHVPARACRTRWDRFARGRDAIDILAGGGLRAEIGTATASILAAIVAMCFPAAALCLNKEILQKCISVAAALQQAGSYR